MDPEDTHDMMLKRGEFLGKHVFTRWLTRVAFFYEHASLQQTVAGIDFPNPVGLAAGFDKDVQLVDILPHVGFGFIEVGSITGEPCEGNPKPRLWRLPKEKSLVVYYGLKNRGSVALGKKLKTIHSPIPLGVSVAKTNCKETADVETGIRDYVKAYLNTKDTASYVTINISCPNAFGGEPFTDSQKLDALLQRIEEVGITKPIFLKLKPDLSQEELDNIIAVVDKHKITGFICSNLAKTELEEGMKGFVGGKIAQQRSDDQVKYVYTKTNGKYVIMGCGGVFNAADAYKKIKNGATLIQLITGMIYEGPQTISSINEGLVRLLKKDGYKNIQEAIGKNVLRR